MTVYTRREWPSQPEETAFAPGVTVVHVPAGPAKIMAKDDLLPWMPEFGRWLPGAGRPTRPTSRTATSG